jgi:GAF domain-containing protein/HAMP domain-containing protein
MRTNSEQTSKKKSLRRYFRFEKYSLRLKILIAFIIFSLLSTIVMAWMSISSASEVLARNIVLSAFLLTLVSFFIAISLSSALTAPIRRLMGIATEITSGNMFARAKIDREDEIGVLAGAINQLSNDLQQNMLNHEQRVSDRTRDLEKRANQLLSVVEICKAAAAHRNVDELLTMVTQQINAKFGYYHAGIFLVEEQNIEHKKDLDEQGGRFAVLRAANSEGGQRMLARGHKLRIQEQGIVGYVIGTGNPRIALNVGEDSKFFNNPDLPETRSEMALALSSGGKIIGALDVQSNLPNAFSRDDLDIMQKLADMVAIAIENAQLFRESNQALETSRRIYGEISRRSWMEILSQRGELSYTSLDYPFSKVSLDQGHVGYEEIENKKDEEAVSQRHYPLSLPIKVRETVIGYLDTYKPTESGGWTPEEYDMVTNIIEQLGVALESARLYENSQLQAERERLVSEVASHIRESLDVDAVLRTAVQELRQSLGISQVEVRLKSAQQGE